MSIKTDNETDALIGQILMYLFTFLAMPLAVMSWGLLVYKTWGWFMPMLPFGLAILTFKQSIVIRMLLIPILPHCSPTAEKAQKTAVEHLVTAMVGTALPLVLICVSWLIYVVIR